MGLPVRRLDEQDTPAVDELRAARARDELLAGAFLLGHREATRAAYRADLQDFFAFCDELAIAAAAARRTHVDAYVEHLRALGASEATVARRLACLHGFYDHLINEDLEPVLGAPLQRLQRNPVERVQRPAVGRDSQRLGLDRDALRALLALLDAHVAQQVARREGTPPGVAAADAQLAAAADARTRVVAGRALEAARAELRRAPGAYSRALRDRALVALLAFTGMRIS